MVYFTFMLLCISKFVTIKLLYTVSSHTSKGLFLLKLLYCKEYLQLVFTFLMYLNIHIYLNWQRPLRAKPLYAY